MLYWLAEILRRTRMRGQRAGATARQHDQPSLRTPEERAQEQAAWEQARERVQRRHAEKHRRQDRKPTAGDEHSNIGGGGL